MKKTFTFEVEYRQYDTFEIKANSEEEALEIAIKKAENEGDGGYGIFKDDSFETELAAG